MQVIKALTRLTYIVCLLALVLIPLIVWARNPIVDLAGVGAFAAGVGVPLGILTGAMAASSIAKSRAKEGAGSE
jgi:hypothetical protein